ncbi:amino acid adenylation domain-containing protein, partial [Bacillus cereus]|uniref:non-ribosomal peptide synthetase n=1 Tax=Bacillus cereus TaxID=1396 RepID=UPI001E369170|nr:amino acid adenylation domain-containing protein [Bacillus cereus]
MTYNLTHAQKRIWYNEKIYGNTSMHNIIGLVRIKKDIDFSKLTEAINIFIKKNDGIRIQIDEKTGEPVQYIENYKKVDIDFFDFSNQDNPSSQLDSLLDKIKKERFNLLNSKLYYFAMFKLGPNDVGYFGKFHHIIADGWAINITGQQISKYYTLLANEEDIDLEEIESYSYIDTINKEKIYLKSERFIKNKMFWNNNFYRLPESLYINKNNDLRANRKSFFIEKTLSSNIRNYVVEHESSINALFVSAVLMYKYLTTREKDLIVGTPVLNRTGKIEKNTFGMFTSTMPFRISIDTNVPSGQFIKNTIKSLKGFYLHQKYPYNLLVSDLELRKKGYEGLFDICINYYNTKFDRLFDESTYENHEVFNGEQPYKLQVVISDWKEHGMFKLDLDYKLSEYSESQIEKMYEHLTNIIKFIIDFPEKTIAEVDMLSEDEKEELIYKLNMNECNYPSSKTFVQIFEEQVYQNPERIACYFEGKYLTYGELNELSNKLANFLRYKGIENGKVVGIAALPSFELIVSIISVLKLDGTYLPIDPATPSDRINFMLKDSGASLLLKNCTLEGTSFNGNVYELNDDSLYTGNGSNLEIETIPESLAYIIYTSGSTGEPKGVMVTNKSLLNYVWWANQTYLTNKNEVFACYSSISFDLTITSIFTPLIGGNSIAIYRDNTDEYVLFRILKDRLTTIVKLTPSHLSIISDLKLEDSNVKKFIVGGEDLKVSLAKRIHNNFGGKITIFNEYGPTETVVGCMIHKYNISNDLDNSVPIGNPAGNVSIYILDHFLKPVSFNVKGEIYVSGPGVAKGYLNKPQLTQDRFLDNPFIPGKKMYKTGDMGMWLENKTIKYFGRSDDQLKINGYRIEIGEIESTLSKYPGITNVAVKILEDFNGSKHLSAYYSSEEEIPEKALITHLHTTLPSYMVPRRIFYLNPLPLTINGKVDKNKLPINDFNNLPNTHYQDARNDVESIFIKVWRDIFRSKTIGIHDDFFSLGGDSIKAIQLMSNLNKYGISISVKDIMTHRSISKISKYSSNNSISYNQNILSGTVKPTPILLWFMENNFNNIHH